MSGLSDELARAQQREQIAAWDRNEAALASQLATTLPLPNKVELDGDTLKHVQIFIAYCASKGVRHCPAKPTTVAAFVVSNGENQERLLTLLASITRLHFLHSIGDPVGTAIVQKALEQVVQIEPPRSWNKGERAQFLTLPVGVRAAIARRETQRELEIRRMQNLTAEKLRQKDSAETKPVKTKTEKELQHGEA